MIPAWTVLPAVFLALLAKYYGFEIVEIIRAKRTHVQRRITEKEWVLVLKYLGIPRTVEPFKTLPEKRSFGYVVFVVPGLVFLFVSLDLTNPNISFPTSYLYSLLFSFLSGVMFFLSVRILLGPKRTWKLTVRYHDVDRYLVPWGELRNDRQTH